MNNNIDYQNNFIKIHISLAMAAAAIAVCWLTSRCEGAKWTQKHKSKKKITARLCKQQTITPLWVCGV